MKKIVTIGGGTGSFTLLRGLKKYDIDLSAIVSMTDDGGSTGELRSELGVLPVGDVRRCLLAMADKDVWYELFTYKCGKELKNHRLGNVILTALEHIKGDLESAIEAAEEILNTKGKVFPVTLDDTRLYAELENGEIIKGETNIDIPKHDGKIPIKRIYTKPKAFAYYKTLRTIENANMIVIGPGDLYTSVVPNFLIEGKNCLTVPSTQPCKVLGDSGQP